MFLEQGFAGALDFGKTLYSSHVNLQHAELNAELAREASITREYDTHDLSSASDSVTRRFVFSLFEKNKNWLKALRLASTTMVDGSAIGLGNFKPEFFAPMGSALCFPIEVIVFCELCEEAIRRLGRTEKKYRRYRVYGDDIIVHRDVTPYLLELFQEYGFIANESKSFYGDEPFRESCGGHYLNGADAIPIQVGRKFVGFPTDLRRHPEAILELIALANSLQDVSESSRKLIIHHLRKHLDIRLGVLFTGDLLDSSRIHSWNPSNYAAPYYYDKDLQKTVNLGGHLSSPESFHLAGEQGLWAWLCTAERRNNVSDSDQRIVFDNRSQWEATRIRTMSDGSRPRICLPD